MENKIEAVWQGWKAVRKIGAGGFGAVYEITRDVFGKNETAALKVISIPQNNDEIKDLYDEGYDEGSIVRHYQSYLETIVREYSLMLDMKGHPNVVYCDDMRYVKHSDGIGWDIFIKMELLTPLLKHIGTAFNEIEVIKLGKDICNALCYCKKQNIVHRDIKPQNIFVSRIGDYKLGDFGIAKISEKTQSGTKIGTFEYMPPEVYSGKPYGASADIYSLGMVLYWLLNNKRIPFLSADGEIPTVEEKTDARMRRLSGEQIPEPLNGGAELKRIVLKACAYRSEDRYSAPEEMLEDLSRINSASAVPLFFNTAETSFKSSNGNTVSFYSGSSSQSGTAESGKSSSAGNAAPDEEITEKVIKQQATAEIASEIPQPQPKAEPRIENKVDYKAYAEADNAVPEKDKKNKKGILFAILGVAAVALIVILILLLRSCGESPAVGESSQTESEPYSETVSEAESTVPESSADDVEISQSPDEESSQEPLHTHSYTSSFTTNETAHWYECECGEVSGMKLHDYGEWVILEEATEKTEGKKERVCADCGYKEEAAVPVLGHVHSYITSWKKNESSHWRECKCGEKDQLSTHDYGDWIVTKAATCTAEGTQKRTCSTCLYSETKSVSATGHSYSNGYCTKCGAHDGVTFTLRLNANGGSVSVSVMTVKKGTAYGTLPTPTRDYYTFNGWFTASSGGTKVTSTTSYTASSDTTLYAQWTQNAESGWVLESEVPSGAQITQTKWTYTRTQTTESTSSTLSGWTKTGEYWNQTGSGSTNYATFPTGYDTSNTYYTNFAKSAYTAYDNGSTKRVVTNTWKGYIYWHWMYNVAYAKEYTRTISHRSGYWDAYGNNKLGYNYQYFFAIASSVDCTYLDKLYCCSQSLASYDCASIITNTTNVGTPRCFRFSYYVSSYVDYEKVYQYQKVTTEESATSVSSGGEISNVQKYVKYRAK